MADATMAKKKLMVARATAHDSHVARSTRTPVPPDERGARCGTERSPGRRAGRLRRPGCRPGRPCDGQPRDQQAQRHQRQNRTAGHGAEVLDPARGESAIGPSAGPARCCRPTAGERPQRRRRPPARDACRRVGANWPAKTPTAMKTAGAATSVTARWALSAQPEAGLGHPPDGQDDGCRGHPERHQSQRQRRHGGGGGPPAGRRPGHQQVPAAGVLFSPCPAGGRQQGPDGTEGRDDAEAAPRRPPRHGFQGATGAEEGSQGPVPTDRASDLTAALGGVIGGRELLDRRRHRQPEDQPPYETAANGPARHEPARSQAGPTFSTHRPASRPGPPRRRRSGPGTTAPTTAPG